MLKFVNNGWPELSMGVDKVRFLNGFKTLALDIGHPSINKP
jgi:hypothetical protein